MTRFGAVVVALGISCGAPRPPAPAPTRSRSSAREGKGIQPEVKVPADQALDRAKKLAAEKLAKLREHAGHE